MARCFKAVTILSMLCLSFASVANFLMQTSSLSCLWTNEINVEEMMNYAINETNVEEKVPEPFDRAVQLAHRLIDSSLPRRGEEQDPRPFVPSKWDKREKGGLLERDRVYLSKVYAASESVFEYGLGESTYIADQVGVPRYAGIDSDAAWIALTREKVADHFRFYFADIGPTVAWGYPKDHGLSKSILNYQLIPMIVEPQPFDVYMVDGRWRLPCVIISFLHASARGGDPRKTVVLLHDCVVRELWNPDNKDPPALNEGLIRPAYKLADHLLDRIDHSGNYLCVYKRKPNTTDVQLLEFWEQNYKEII